MTIKHINEYFNNGKSIPQGMPGRPRLRNERSGCGQSKIRPHDAFVVTGVFVYFIFGAGHTVVKVGRTSNLTKRIASIQNGNPAIIRVAALIEVPSVDGAKAVEYFLHRKLKGAGRHVSGEWFRMGLSEIGSACQLCEGEFVSIAKTRFVASHDEDENRVKFARTNRI